MDRSRDCDPARDARLRLGVAVLPLATAAAIAWMCERTLALPARPAASSARRPRPAGR